MHLVPALRSVPLRVEYRLRLNSARPPWGQDKNNNIGDADDAYSENIDDNNRHTGSGSSGRRRRDAEKKVVTHRHRCTDSLLNI
jgi:hypothetical protein